MKTSVVVDWGQRTLFLREFPSAPALPLTVQIGPIQFTGANMAFVLPDDKTATVSITPQDAHGNPAQIDGAPIWTVADSTLLALTPSEDGMSATLTPIGALGSSQVSVSVDADLGEGITSVVGVLDVSVVAGPAVSVAVSAALNT